MSAKTTTLSKACPIALPPRSCPACGVTAPSLLALLPSGRRALVEACAVCGRHVTTPVSCQDAYMLLKGESPQALTNGPT